ncbi:hypothetical protein TrVE_jg9301 [Triparma verrucosa]|uniref:CCR4-NOT transcription complex subunit 1-like NOT1 connector domain-containing protein n=1 Tax=Triparma verrucosa TaxID=1606542 RepID=A0A9W7CHE4_9STRA|nr:hypothetical protein TrVE_jg9301 [Triparma verrucosa]
MEQDPDAKLPPPPAKKGEEEVFFPSQEGWAPPPAGAGVVADGNMKTLTMLAQKLNMSVNSLLAAAGNRSGEVTYMMLPENHEVKSIIAEIRKVGGASSDDVSLSFAQTIFKQMYDLTLNEPLRLESLIEILTAVNEGCSKLSKDVTVWITYAPMSTEEEKKLHRTVLLLLVRAQLVKSNELDAWMSHSMKGGPLVDLTVFTVDGKDDKPLTKDDLLRFSDHVEKLSQRKSPRPRDEGSPDEDNLKGADKIQMKYQAYSTMALVAALQVGFGINDFAAADVDDLWGFLHAAILSLVIIGNFIGAGVLTLEYFYALRLFVEGRKDDDGVPIYLNFVDGCSGIRQRVSGYITKSMFFYIVAVGLGFAKEQNGAFNWKSITILAIIFSGALALVYSLVSVHVVLAQAGSTELRSQSSRTVAVNVINPKSRQRGNGNNDDDGVSGFGGPLGVSPHL